MEILITQQMVLDAKLFMEVCEIRSKRDDADSTDVDVAKKARKHWEEMQDCYNKQEAIVRAWAAEQMRGLVVDEASHHGFGRMPMTFNETTYPFDQRDSEVWNWCRAETLANIEKWESSNG